MSDQILTALSVSKLLQDLVAEIQKVDLGEQTIWESYEAQWKLVQASPLNTSTEENSSRV